jgi:hypothetical protein
MRDIARKGRALVKALPGRLATGGPPVTFDEAQILHLHSNHQVAEIMRLREALTARSPDFAIREEMRRLIEQVADLEGRDL